MNESDLGKTGRHGGRASPYKSGQAMDTLAFDPPVSEPQRRAMFAAAEGNSTLGIPKKVGEEFVGDDAKGRWGGRAADWAAQPDDNAEAQDVDPEKVWSLYRRPGTEGEKSAAEAALRRMGEWKETESRTEQKRPAQGPKRFSVTLRYEVNGKTMNFGPETVEAGDQIDAENKVRKMAKQHWAQTVGGKPPEFRASNTQRV